MALIFVTSNSILIFLVLGTISVQLSYQFPATVNLTWKDLEKLQYKIWKYGNFIDLLLPVTKRLSCALDIKYAIETFTIRYLQVPDGFQQRQSNIHTSIKDTMKNRATTLKGIVKGFIKLTNETPDRKKFENLWWKLIKFQIYKPPNGDYSTVLPLEDPIISEDLWEAIVMLATSKDLESAWANWNKYKATWSKRYIINIDNTDTNSELSNEDRNTLLEFSLLSGSALNEFFKKNELIYPETTYAKGVIEAGKFIRQPSGTIDKKYTDCFWTLYISENEHIVTSLRNFETKWQLIRSRVVDRVCHGMTTLYDLVAWADLYWPKEVGLLKQFEPTSEDFKDYISRIALKDETAASIIGFLLRLSD